MNLAPLADEVMSRCDALAGCSDEPGRLTRLFLGAGTRQAHELLRQWMKAANLGVRLDAVGNLIGRRTGTNTNGKIVLVGSHIDTVPNAGRYDGQLGILLGIAICEALKRKAFPRPFDVIAFSEEEGVRYRKPYLGSAAIAGQFDAKWLDLQDESGKAVRQAIAEYGLDPKKIGASSYAPQNIAGYIEAHIEQGPLLESRDLSLGVVTGIVGQSRIWIRFVGRANHAGTTPIQMRHDALCAAAEFISGVETAAWRTSQLRATVGSMDVLPGAANVIPGTVRLSVDIRHADDHVRQRAVKELSEKAKQIAEARGLEVSIETAMDQAALLSDEKLTDRLAAVLQKSGRAGYRMVSGAGHDAVMMSRLCPTTMLFLRTPNGLSHHPDEAVRRDDVVAALQVLVEFVSQELSVIDP
ncbi:MAG: allantoate amidohydrolase [Gemmataceae bacterium]